MGDLITSNTMEIRPMAAISIINPDNRNQRVVYGLSRSETQNTRLELRTIFVEGEFDTPQNLMLANERAKALRAEIASGEVSVSGGWGLIGRNPTSTVLYEEKFYGRITGVDVRTTVSADPEGIAELGRLLESTYGKLVPANEEGNIVPVGPEGNIAA